MLNAPLRSFAAGGPGKGPKVPSFLQAPPKEKAPAVKVEPVKSVKVEPVEPVKSVKPKKEVK